MRAEQPQSRPSWRFHADSSAENRAIASHTAKTAMRIDAAMPDGDALAVRTAA